MARLLSALTTQRRPPLAQARTRFPNTHSTHARTDNDCVVSFGKGEDGQLGHGDAESCAEPTAVAALRGKHISSVSCGAGEGARAEGGGLRCSWWDAQRLLSDDHAHVL